jgi:hypothetical protein
VTQTGKKAAVFFCGVLVLSLVCLAGASAVDMADYLGNTLAGELASKGRLNSVTFADKSGNVSFKLMPKDKTLWNRAAATNAALKPTVITEFLQIFKKPEGSPQVWGNQEWAEVYNRALNLGTLDGVEYYSTSHKRNFVLYRESYFVNNMTDKQRLPFPTVSVDNMPAEIPLTAYQRDGAFGENYYSYDYQFTGSSIVIAQQNLTNMVYHDWLPSVSKNNLRTLISAVDAGDNVLIYIVSMAKVSSLANLFRDHISASFSNRAIAVLGWFQGQLADAFK